jgi:LAS superfamily LD-carboxypeptidase LdcB
MAAALINNGSTWGDIEKGTNIRLSTVSGSREFGVGGGGKMLNEAVIPLQEMAKDLAKHLKDTGHKGNNGVYVTIGSTFRSYTEQEKLCCGSVGCYKDGVKCSQGVAAPGKSMHGWGIAVDFQFYDKEGKVIKIRPIASDTGKIGFESESYKWLFNNAPYYGYVNPSWARNGGNYDEYWHFEYHGKAAISLMLKNPRFEAWGTGQRYTWSKKGDYFDFVKNPLDINGVESKLDCKQSTNTLIDNNSGDGNTGPIPASKSLIKVLKNAGYKLIEARDEVKNPSKYATGPHWHVVIGK